MPLTPEDIRAKEFHTSIRGYKEVEVDAFLDEVEAEITRLLAANADLAQRLSAATAAPPVNESDEMLRRTLLLAQRTADETVAAAQVEAERMVEDARTRAQETLTQARTQADAALGDLERRKQTLEQHIEGLRAFEREYRTRLKAYLESQLRELEGRGAPAAPPPSQPAPQAAPPPAPSPVSPSQPIFTPAGQQPGPGDVPRVAP